jgi:F-type H+-transporting ATPase subunit gamma
MAKTRDLKRRIRSIRNTMQLTRAMKMVSAAKLRRSQERIFAARPYARQLDAVLQSLAARANPELHPLLQVRPEERVELIVVTSDRGLCGSFNTNILKRGLAFLRERGGRSLEVQAVGRKGRDFFRRRPWAVRRERVDVLRSVDYALAADIGREVVDRYADGRVDAVYLLYNEFKSAVAQRPVIERLLPISRAEVEGGSRGPAEDYIYEPDPQSLFLNLLPHHVEMQVYRALLESVAAEHAARMAAMSAATSNAGELIEKLTLQMNRMRQAAITTEIIEVVSGAEALG